MSESVSLVCLILLPPEVILFYFCLFIGAAANEGVLANFFNSLLSKKTGAPGSPGSPGAGAGVQGSAKKTGKFLLFQPQPLEWVNLS